MRITAVRLRRLTGTLPTQGDVWEDRLVRPLDVYDEYRHRSDFEGGVQGPDGFHITTFFVDIETDEGVLGRAGPVPEGVAFIIAKSLRRLLLGQDPIAGEKLWDQMHRAMVHGRQGDAMLAISAVDCALWDLRGKWLGQPVYRLLGGPTRTRVPAYASMLGFAVLDPGRVRERAQAFKAAGYTAQKWFFRHGPMSGHEGLAKNVELVRTVREAVGDDYDIMFDCWQAMDVTYVERLAEQGSPSTGRAGSRNASCPTASTATAACATGSASRWPVPSTNTPAGASSASSTPARWTCCSRTSTGAAACPRR